MSMLRVKCILSALLVAAALGAVPAAHAAPVTLLVNLSGSSAMWQTLALGAYNSGTSTVSGGGITCHWTSASNVVNLVDARTSPSNSDAGTTWVVWDNNADPSTCAADGTATVTNVWMYTKVDSVVGVRCYFAKCYVNATSGNVSTAGANQITLSGGIWGGSAADKTMPATIQSLLTGTSAVTGAATDIRPEDAAFATCRVNSSLGASAYSSAGTSDGLDGLGYNTNNAAGVCPAYSTTGVGAQARGQGNPIKSFVSSAQANVLAFNLFGKDPITNATVPAFTVTAVGAAPIMFVVNHGVGPLASVTNATEQQLQQVFSGTGATPCDASLFGSAFSGAINVFLREPLSGTMNTTEATVFRHATTYSTSGGSVLGVSQETGINPANANNNPLNLACGSGERFRGVGTGDVISGVLNSNTSTYGTRDGIGYTFFSYGNVKKLITANTGYITLDGVDPVWESYGAGKAYDPGQSTTAGAVPAEADLPASCGTAGSFPCAENFIWGNGFSFPHLRDGTYRAWSLIRVLGTGTSGTAITNLVKASQKFVVNDVPDYVPATAVTGTTDLGLKLLRSHYMQRDGAGTPLGATGNAVYTATNSPEKGGDMGGQIIPTTIGVTTYKVIQSVQSSQSSGGLNPEVRPQ